MFIRFAEDIYIFPLHKQRILRNKNAPNPFQYSLFFLKFILSCLNFSTKHNFDIKIENNKIKQTYASLQDYHFSIIINEQQMILITSTS